MRRAERLFQIIQTLRRASSKPLTAEAIAAEIETSKRTVYRDIAALIGQRVPIRGGAGIGYVLEHGFDLPPLMLTSDEIEAVALGAQWVAAHGDPSLARAAEDVLAKVTAVIARLTRAGLMKAPGVAEVARAKADGRWQAAYSSPKDMVIPNDFLRAVGAHDTAAAHLGTSGKTHRYVIGLRLQTARTPRTRARRFESMLELLKKGETPR